MKYTKYIALVVTLSLLNTVTLTSAASGAVTASTGTGVSAPTSPLAVKSAPRLVKKTADSITLEWDTVPAAVSYIVKYSKKSVANSQEVTAQYDNETDPLTDTGVVITKLSSNNEALIPATSYYFSLVAVDKDGAESDTFSDEIMVITDASGVVATGSTTAFAIKDLIVTNDKTLSLSFNSALSTAPVGVKITKTSDNSDILVGTVTPDQTNPNAVVVTTLVALSPSSSYTLTVLSAKDAAGNNITEGVSGLKEFTTTETLKLSTSTETPALNAAGIDPSTLSGGETLSGATTTNADVTAATKVETGAKENVIIFIALILSLGIVYIYRRKLV